MNYKLLTVVIIWDKKLIWNNILSLCFRQSYIHVHKNPTKCSSMQIYISCKLTLRASGSQHLSTGVLNPFSTPDDGCCYTRNM